MFSLFHSSLFRRLWFLQHHFFFPITTVRSCFSLSIFLFNEVHWVTASSVLLFHFNLFISRHSYHFKHFSHCCCLHKVGKNKIYIDSIKSANRNAAIISLLNFIKIVLNNSFSIVFYAINLPSFPSLTPLNHHHPVPNPTRKQKQHYWHFVTNNFRINLHSIILRN